MNPRYITLVRLGILEFEFEIQDDPHDADDLAAFDFAMGW